MNEDISIHIETSLSLLKGADGSVWSDTRPVRYLLPEEVLNRFYIIASMLSRPLYFVARLSLELAYLLRSPVDFVRSVRPALSLSRLISVIWQVPHIEIRAQSEWFCDMWFDVAENGAQ